MSYRTRQQFQADVDTLYGLFTDREFLTKKYLAVGSRNLEILECGQDDEVFRIEWRREVPSNPPGFARKVLSEWNQLEEIMEWERLPDGGARADYLGKVRGVPGELRGEFTLMAGGGGTVEEILMQATVNIPLVGKKIASFAEDDAAANLEKEYRFTLEYLDEV